MLKEFKEFAMRGSVLDMAVGIIIGAAFGKVVTSFVNDMMMPPLGLLLGQVDFRELALTLATESGDKPVRIGYGIFLNSVIDFVLVAFAIFLLVKGINHLKRQAPPAPPGTRECPLCLSAIPVKARRCAHCTADVSPA